MSAKLEAREPVARYLATPPLLQHFDRVAQAPGGVARLRELILTLAVQGKLLPQDPADEPASVLLERIREEKARLVKAGKIRKDKPLAAIEEEKQFALPAGWEWVRLIQLLTKIGAGSTPLGGKEVYVSEGIKFLRSQNVWNEGLRLIDVAYIKPETHMKMSGTTVFAGDILFNITGASIGRCAVVPTTFDEANVSQHVTIIRPTLPTVTPYLHLVLISPHVQQTVMDVQVGVSREGLSIGKLGLFLVPIPPLAEQSRIVARVEELMALCDALEDKGQLAAAQHERLAGALLDALANSASAEEAAEHWQRIAAHFDLLLDRPAAVDRLEQAILQLAVRGRLVPQNPADKPASALLQKIRTEKDHLIATGQLKRDKPLPPISDEEKPFALPDGWEWARFGELILSSDAGWSPSCESTPREGNEWGVLKVSAVSWGEFRPEENKALPAGLFPKPEFEVKPEDFLLSRANTEELVARSVIAWEPPGRLMMSDKLIRLRLSSHIDKALYCEINNSRLSRDYYIVNASGTSSSMKNVSREVILKLMVPVPPAPEQSRIVARVAELRALCTQLRDRLATTSQTRSRLAEALLEQAVA
ncbi:MAG: restriction endonuclease subunit S [Azonexus sp.]|nr:restriction endonuclease subunit S [Azonexus sp.]